MLNTLTMRNAKRSAKNYLIYLVTMTIVSSLMFALNGMIFSSDVNALYQKLPIFPALVGLATFFVIIVIIWLVHYMVNFMLEKRSKEFGTYLILGMEKKQISRIFRRENTALGLVSMLLGIIPGYVFQKLFINVFYSVLNIDYHISLEIQPLGILLTAAVLFIAYLFSLAGVSKSFKKLRIYDLMNFDKQNEQTVIGDTKTWRAVFLFVSIAYIILFNTLVFTVGLGSFYSALGFIAGLILAIYLLYFGLSSFFVDFIKRKTPIVYKSANLFVFRQLASKIRTMRFTMGTLTILFTLTLLGWTCVMMLVDYQQTEIDNQIPFELAVFSDMPDYTFAEQLQVINENANLSDYHIYNIYRNDSNVINEYLYAHVRGTEKTTVFINGKMGPSSYYGYDTFIGLSDYNRIRGMIGLSEVTLEDGRYILHGKEKIDNELSAVRDTVPVIVNGRTLFCQSINMEPLQQNRMNGADYLVVVQDKLLPELSKYYSMMAGSLEGEVPLDLQTKLDATQHFLDEESNEDLYSIEMGEGSNQIMIIAANVMVAENLKVDGIFVTVSVCFIMAYMGIVFLCAALTVMAVQQLSDSEKHRFRYELLKKIGMSKREIEGVVFKQLEVYYLCPYIISIILSSFLGMFISKQFVYFTGINAADFQYYFLAFMVFSLLYAGYFIVSHVSFVRNLENR